MLTHIRVCDTPIFPAPYTEWPEIRSGGSQET